MTNNNVSKTVSLLGTIVAVGDKFSEVEFAFKGEAPLSLPIATKALKGVKKDSPVSFKVSWHKVDEYLIINAFKVRPTKKFDENVRPADFPSYEELTLHNLKMRKNFVYQKAVKEINKKEREEREGVVNIPVGNSESFYKKNSMDVNVHQLVVYQEQLNRAEELVGQEVAIKETIQDGRFYTASSVVVMDFDVDDNGNSKKFFRELEEKDEYKPQALFVKLCYSNKNNEEKHFFKRLDDVWTKARLVEELKK